MDLGLSSPSAPNELVDALVARIPAGADVVIPIANGEPVALLDGLEAEPASPGGA